MKVMHDLVLLMAPPGVEHACDYCKPAEEDIVGLTDEEQAAKLADAVAAAVAERDAKIAELTDKLGERDASEATKQAVTDAIAPLETKVSELQSALDAAEIARAAAETERTALVDWLTAEAEVDAAATRRQERIDAVKDVGIFPEDSFDESKAVNKDRIDKWADMDDEIFADLVDGWKLGRPAKAADAANGDLPSKRSAITDAVTEGAQNGSKSAVSRVLEGTIPSLASQASS